MAESSESDVKQDTTPGGTATQYRIWSKSQKFGLFLQKFFRQCYGIALKIV